LTPGVVLAYNLFRHPRSSLRVRHLTLDGIEAA
jgi:hypothetical protein